MAIETNTNRESMRRLVCNDLGMKTYKMKKIKDNFSQPKIKVRGWKDARPWFHVSPMVDTS